MNDEDKTDIITNLRTDDFAMIGERAIKDVSIRDLVTIRVYVRGGLVSHVENIPPEIEVDVLDFDTEGQNENPHSSSKQCTISVWHG